MRGTQSVGSGFQNARTRVRRFCSRYEVRSAPPTPAPSRPIATPTPWLASTQSISRPPRTGPGTNGSGPPVVGVPVVASLVVGGPEVALSSALALPVALVVPAAVSPVLSSTQAGQVRARIVSEARREE